VLSEETLIVLAALGAAGLLLLGLLELLWPTRPKHPTRRREPVVVRHGAARRRKHSRHALLPGHSPYVRRAPPARRPGVPSGAAGNFSNPRF